ncbi:MAG TPA: type I-E CRISPR-associated protein Cse1/CasA [Chloroflexaceae bacterium]|nr:type I-E CRISPR-associated protein Cse1/CasA [Chloroflexaceae bacterium]
MNDLSVSFNLWTEPWIRVTDRGGAETVLSIGGCLADAHTLAALSDPSPLVVGGTHRLLAAILQAIYAPRDLGELAALLDAGQFDPARLAQFADRHAERFDLFHATAPFLQTGDVPLDGWRKPEKGQKRDWSEPKSAASLLAELPTATKRTHFQHVTDAGHWLCPACCARALITIPAFASSEGAGIRPSINGVPPVYVLPAADNLFESLALSLVSPDYQPASTDPRRADTAAWSGPTSIGKSNQASAVGYIESLTFPARRVRLYPQYRTQNCTQCDLPTTVGVSSVLSEMGHWLSEGSGIWEDPFAAFRQPRGRGKSDEAGPRPIRPEEGKALWREYGSLLLIEREGELRPAVVRQTAKLIDRGALGEAQLLRFRCVGIRTDGKAKIFEWLDESLEAPPALLTDERAAWFVDSALEWANDVRFILESSFNSHFRPERDRGGHDQKLARFKTVRARMSADYWGRLAPRFRSFIAELAGADDSDATARAWANDLVRIGRQCFDTAAEQIGERADALRARVEAQAACHRRLSAKRKEWFGDDK